MAGYWRRPELTAERFPRTEGLFPELRTGDYGWQDKDGYSTSPAAGTTSTRSAGSASAPPRSRPPRPGSTE